MKLFMVTNGYQYGPYNIGCWVIAETAKRAVLMARLKFRQEADRMNKCLEEALTKPYYTPDFWERLEASIFMPDIPSHKEFASDVDRQLWEI